MLPKNVKIVVRGAGDLGSGVLHRLWRAGFQPLALELPEPLAVRREVSFAAAINRKEIQIEGVTGKHVNSVASNEDFIPVLIDPGTETIEEYSPHVLIDATMPRYSEKITPILDLAPATIGVGPGFKTGADVDFVVETKAGNDLGRVLSQGQALPADGEPCNIESRTMERVLRSPADGTFSARCKIGDVVEPEETLGEVAGEHVKAEIEGIIRGLISDDREVEAGLKIGDIDPRIDQDLPHTISYKARAVGGGVLEATMHFLYRNNYSQPLTGRE